MEKITYHVTTAAEWGEAQRKGFYEAPSLQTEGFIHCSDESQVQGVLKRYFTGKGPLVKLTIAPAKLHSRLQYDFSPSINEMFPHIYGRINLDAVVETVDLGAY